MLNGRVFSSITHRTRTGTALPVAIFLLLTVPTLLTSGCTVDQKRSAANDLRGASQFVSDAGSVIAPVNPPLGALLSAVGLAGVAVCDSISKRRKLAKATAPWDGQHDRRHGRSSTRIGPADTAQPPKTQPEVPDA